MVHIQHKGSKRYMLIAPSVLGDTVNWVDDPRHANSYHTKKAAGKEIHFYQVHNAEVVYKEDK